MCAIAIGGVIAVAGVEPPNAAALLARVEAAHRVIPSIETRYEIAALCEGPTGAEVRELVTMSPRTSRWVDPLSGREYLIWQTARALYNGRDGWRIETEELTAIGPRELATSVKLQTLGVLASARATKAVSANIEIGGGPPSAERSPAYLGETELRRQRMFSMEELVAREGYPTLVAWAARLLRSADDLRLVENEHGTGVASASLGLELWADPVTGEATGVRVDQGKIGPSSWWFEGRFDEPLFPARHPRVARMTGPRPASKELIDGTRHIFQRVEVKPHDPALFATTSLAAKLYNASLVECDATGQPLAKPAAMASRKPPAATDERAAELAETVGRSPRSLIAAALACFVVAGIVWWRRRASA